MIETDKGEEIELCAAKSLKEEKAEELEKESDLHKKLLKGDLAKYIPDHIEFLKDIKY